MRLLNSPFQRDHVKKDLDRINAVANEWLALTPDEGIVDDTMRFLEAHPADHPHTVFINRFMSEKLGLQPAVSGLFGLGLLHAIHYRSADQQQVVNPITQQEASDVEGLAARLMEPEIKREDVYRATSFVEFLLQEFGPKALIDFGRSIPESGSFDQAAKAATGKSLAMLELAWQASVHPEGGQRRGLSVITWTVRATRPYLTLRLLMLLGMAIQIGYAVMLPIWLQQLFDNGIMAQSASGVELPLTLLVVGLVLTSSAGLLTDYCVAALGPKVMNTLRVKMFEKVQAMSERSLGAYDSGEISSNFTNDLVVLEKAVVWAVPGIVPKALIILGSVVVAFTLQWLMAIAMLVVLGLTIFVPRIISKWAVRTAYARGIEDAKIVRTVREDVNLATIVRDFSLRDFRLARLKKQIADLYKASFIQYFSSGLTGRATNFGVSVAQLLVVGLGGFLAVGGDVSGGTVVAFIGLLLNIGGAATFVGGQLPILIQAAGGLERVETLLKQTEDVKEPKEPVDLETPLQSVTFDHVSFSYTGEKTDLDDVSIDVKTPLRVALVGPSGSGKSTILNLLTRQFDVTEGQILFNGVDIRNIADQRFRSLMAVVTQDTSLFQTTVRENIRMGRLDASDEEVEQAAREADVHDVIMGLSEGYETDVGDMGKKLSGGQRQRIAIARAVLRKPEILVLDEATSALDNASQTEVAKTLDRVTAGKTVFAVTHKLADCETMDLVCVLDGGKLVETGSHTELLAKDGLYAKLWNQGTTVEISDDGREVRPVPGKLRHITMLAEAPIELLEKFASSLEVLLVDSNTILRRQGEVVDRFWLVGRGLVASKARSSGGTDLTIEKLGAGDSIGLGALIDDVVCPTTLETLTPCTLLTIGKQELINLFREGGLLSDHFLDDMRHQVDRELEYIAFRKTQLAVAD
ncbi:MAG: ATP-binding cassette domain-containing protein [Pseudomonadota bacterium]